MQISGALLLNLRLSVHICSAGMDSDPRDSVGKSEASIRSPVADLMKPEMRMR